MSLAHSSEDDGGDDEFSSLVSRLKKPPPRTTSRRRSPRKHKKSIVSLDPSIQQQYKSLDVSVWIVIFSFLSPSELRLGPLFASRKFSLAARANSLWESHILRVFSEDVGLDLMDPSELVLFWDRLDHLKLSGGGESRSVFFRRSTFVGEATQLKLHQSIEIALGNYSGKLSGTKAGGDVVELAETPEPVLPDSTIPSDDIEGVEEEAIVWYSRFCRLSMRQRLHAPLKLAVCGAEAVGKSSFVRQFLTGDFREDEPPTIMAAHHCSFDLLDVTISPEAQSQSRCLAESSRRRLVQFEIFDCTGRERERRAIPMYWKQADAVFVCYAVDDLSSLDYAKGLAEEILEYHESDVRVMFVGLERGDVGGGVLDDDDGEDDFAAVKSSDVVDFVRTRNEKLRASRKIGFAGIASAKDGSSVVSAFARIAELVLSP